MDINFNKSTNITWKPDNTLEVASSNGHVSKITCILCKLFTCKR